ncbi:hypothetical protein OOU_Y34scaffold00487g58 [Pyricularia oryzae Y34]|uniref:Uncharacterized protein n=2 Tax=Pyricularia oryzae TaxID=318829 RepID=A0AA97PMD2_PYRO3|nr:hypothetical protein OOU_Y34scaffold00487g58 [Pyricularia oryzae Y34]
MVLRGERVKKFTGSPTAPMPTDHDINGVGPSNAKP